MDGLGVSNDEFSSIRTFVNYWSAGMDHNRSSLDESSLIYHEERRLREKGKQISPLSANVISPASTKGCRNDNSQIGR